MTDAGDSAALGLVQQNRKRAIGLALAAALAVLPFLRSQPAGSLHEAVEGAGLALIAAAIVGRAWCTLYIGGRKLHELVTAGPYSISRNPL